MTHGAGTFPDPASTDKRTALRGDIEGLRALAVVSVLLYHAGLAWTPGGFVGVDVFFVISGFLITSLMLREVQREGCLRLGRFWARRARRLLPASALVLAFSAVVTVLWLPVISRKDFGGDIVGAGLYLVNWRLGYREVDYLAEGVGASPVQHYWSLAVEEQFYIVWPLLIALVIALVRRKRHRALLVTILAVSAASFAWSVHYSVAQPGLSFFVSTTRLWELGVGALLALAYPRVTSSARWLREAVGWGGLAAIGYAVLVIDGTTVWPGVATLLPVLGTAAVILAGGAGSDSTTLGRLLGTRPAVWVGGLSYSLYLWHWPFLIAALGIWGDDLRVRFTLLVVLASAIPAWLSYRFVENPIRFSRRLAPTRRALVAGGALSALSGLVGLAVIGSHALVDTIPVASQRQAPGAAVLIDPDSDVDWSQVDQVDVLRADPTDADRPGIQQSTDCIVNRTQDLYQACEFGKKDIDHTVVLVGDSKAA
ncbi:MAG: acyltransferase, partial [Nocardioidaceae bacterium]|nr:acyltransferase [Nocardioidaceae bacterium]